jgi:feruloyl-CoA synthase
VREFLQRLVDELWASGTGSATRVARALVLAEPPSIDRGEITDKGSINQRAVLTHRKADVERMYLGRDRDVLVPRRQPSPQPSPASGRGGSG